MNRVTDKAKHLLEQYTLVGNSRERKKIEHNMRLLQGWPFSSVG